MKNPFKNVTAIIFNKPEPQYIAATIRGGLVKFTDNGEEFIFEHTHFHRREGRPVLISKKGELKIGRYTYAYPAQRVQSVPTALVNHNS